MTAVYKQLFWYCGIICLFTIVFSCISSLILFFLSIGLVILQAGLICFDKAGLNALAKSILLSVCYLIQDIGMALNPFDRAAAQHSFVGMGTIAGWFRLALLGGAMIAFVLLLLGVLIKNRNEPVFRKLGAISLFPSIVFLRVLIADFL